MPLMPHQKGDHSEVALITAKDDGIHHQRPEEPAPDLNGELSEEPVPLMPYQMKV